MEDIHHNQVFKVPLMLISIQCSFVSLGELNKDVYIVQYINTTNLEQDQSQQTNTTTPTTSEPETQPKFFAMGVSYVSKYHMPEEIDRNHI